jgi:glycosyltransferase involved in cell wall biosynthesis
VPDEELPYYFAAADIVVLPYRKVLTSGMVFWPLSYGVPVIVPGFPPIAELLSNGESAFLYAPGDISSLRDSLESALRQPDLARKIGEAGRERISGMDWRTSIAHTSELYLRLAGEHAGAHPEP